MEYTANPELYNLKHVGTREQHLHDLIEHWASITQLMDDHRGRLTTTGQNVREELGVVVEYLKRFAMREFNEFDAQRFYRKEVNSATS